MQSMRETTSKKRKQRKERHCHVKPFGNSMVELLIAVGPKHEKLQDCEGGAFLS